MRILGLDFETTGLDLENDRITEAGAVLWETDTNTPLKFFHHYVLPDAGMRARFTPETTEMMARLCGITPAMLEEFGVSPNLVLSDLSALCDIYGVKVIVTHNGNGYDKPLLLNELKRHALHGTPMESLHWVDTKQDLPHRKPPESNKLKHLALDNGFINPFAHRAIFDVLTMLKVLATFDIEEVITYSKIPSKVIRAVVPHPKQDQGKGKDFAKANGYRWQEIDYKVYDLCWVKKIKEDQLDAEKARLAPYPVVVLS